MRVPAPLPPPPLTAEASVGGLPEVSLGEALVPRVGLTVELPRILWLLSIVNARNPWATAPSRPQNLCGQLEGGRLLWCARPEPQAHLVGVRLPCPLQALRGHHRSLELTEAFLEVLRLGQVPQLCDDPQCEVQDVLRRASALQDAGLHAMPLLQEGPELVYLPLQIVLVNHGGEAHAFDLHSRIETELAQELLMPLAFLVLRLPVELLLVLRDRNEAAQRRVHLRCDHDEVRAPLPGESQGLAEHEVAQEAGGVDHADLVEWNVVIGNHLLRCCPASTPESPAPTPRLWPQQRGGPPPAGPSGARIRAAAGN
mmetsp:Transcript_22573/g.71607  ORF Transcript_22573/g.71607 Transcript_22573/m.71607 type:complete len:313 (+) Transcript_22573:29-967(+)